MGHEQSEPTYSFPDMDSDERLKELIIYISDKCSGDSRFGATKLNKILYFADFISYLNYGEPITGAAYIKQQRGPVPRDLRDIRDDMEAEGEITVRSKRVFDYVEQRVVPLREANLEPFSARDIGLIDEIIEAMWGRPAYAVSRLSHDAAWKMANQGEGIPYQAVYLSDEGIDEDDIRRGRELVAEYEWAS